MGYVFGDVRVAMLALLTPTAFVASQYPGPCAWSASHSLRNATFLHE